MSIDLVVNEIEQFIPLIKTKQEGRFLIYRLDGGRNLSVYIDLATVEFNFDQFSRNHPDAEESDILGGGFLRINYKAKREVEYVHHCGKCNSKYPVGDKAINDGCSCGSRMFITTAIKGELDHKYNPDDDYDLFFLGCSKQYGGIPEDIAEEVISKITNAFKHYEEEREKKYNPSIILRLCSYIWPFTKENLDNSFRKRNVTPQNYLFDRYNSRNRSCWENWRKEC
ncbi:MAG: hypothetical protein Q8Q01_04650 [archaeon]|nr:hypothetical protein [archaeon]